jgi:hypothetical protein
VEHFACPRTLECGMRPPIAVSALLRFQMMIALLVLAAALLAPSARAQGPFPDIPPCHWAAEAVTEIAGKPDVALEQARSSVYLAENAVRQVFEGLRCGSPEWSRAFLSGEPDGWTRLMATVDFQLNVGGVQLSGDHGTANVQVTLIVNGNRTLGSGPVSLLFTDGSWTVDYDSLSALRLPIFQ